MSNDRRHELTDNQWKRLEPHLSGKNGDVGRPCDDNRRFINAVLWITRSGAPWRDLPERYGKWITAYQRDNRWSKAGRWEAIYRIIRAEEGVDMDWAAADSTIVRAHQHAAGQKKRTQTAHQAPMRVLDAVAADCPPKSTALPTLSAIRPISF
jgi:putative transposase